MAGALPPAGATRALLARVAARLTTPFAYLAVFGGLQILLASILHALFGWWLALLFGGIWLLLLTALAFLRERWRLKLAAISLLAAISAVLPTVSAMLLRSQRGLTSEHDGLLQIESAVDRLLHGEPIYGVDWSATPMAAFPWALTPGPNPALHHMAYYPLTVLVGVPFRLAASAMGLVFDYRVVLIAFALLGLGAILALPIEPQRRFMVICAIYLSPLITLYLWPGRNDIEFLACVFLALALLARGHVSWAAAALGVATALKPFAWLALPFLVLVLYLRWRASHSARVLALSLLALAAAPLLTVMPFFLANPTAFWNDTVLYATGGIADAYPIAGYGFGGLLFELGIIAHRTDAFPFGLFQLAAMVPVLWLTTRSFLRRPTIGRWMGGYACVLFAFAFFARFFNDNYVGVVISLLLCAGPLGQRWLVPVPQQRERLAA
jgi:hypothetical protein